MKITLEDYSTVIIAYHYVINKKKNKYKNLKGISLNLFESQVKKLKKKFNIIGPEELVYYIKTKKTSKKPSILFTFDDGYRDHYKNVFPVLEAQDVKGCFYPPIDIFKNKLLQVNKIQLILEKKISSDFLIKYLLKMLVDKFNINITSKDIKKINLKCRYDDKNTVLFKRLLQYYLPPNIRDHCLNILFSKFVEGTEQFHAKNLYLNLKDLIKMKKAGMHIGSHGSNHLRWEALKESDQKKDITKSKEFLKKNKLLSKEFTVCYPWGTYNTNTLKILKKENTKFALTSKFGIIDFRKRGDPLKLPRLDANDIKFLF